jgi:hypothetical protein
LADHANTDQFAEALRWFVACSKSQSTSLHRAARLTANQFTREKCARKIVNLYAHQLATQASGKSLEESTWQKTAREIGNEWHIIRNIAHAVGKAVLSTDSDGRD